jgi:hypothetical protein
MTEPSGISTWRLRSAVVQANTIAGWRYLDLSGMVINRLSNTYEQVQVTTDGTILTESKIPEAPNNVQFTPQRIVLRYIPLESLQRVKDTAYDLVRSIAEDIDVARFNRLGFRCQYFIPTNNFEQVSRSYLTKLRSSILAALPHPEDESSVFEFRFPFQSEDFKVILRLSAVQRGRPHQQAEEYPSDGIVFDADVYQRGEFRRTDASRFVSNASDRAESLVSEIGIPLLEGVSL